MARNFSVKTDDGRIIEIEETRKFISAGTFEGQGADTEIEKSLRTKDGLPVTRGKKLGEFEIQTLNGPVTARLI
jgi:hypothetical protein